jgi:SAM-dependent methyltransferase
MAGLEKEATVVTATEGEYRHSLSIPLSEDSKGHHYGNFHKYYDFHNPSARYSPLLTNTNFFSLWNDLHCPDELYFLDIGCNEGNLTIEILKIVKEQLPIHVHCVILGIDIDEKLIQKAQEKYSHIEDAIFVAADCLIPNVVLDIMKNHQISKFALVTAFSITMWIHMNHGDVGLQRFLQLMYEITSYGILIEPQKWISYRKAMQRCRRMKILELPHYQDLQIHDIETFIEQFYTTTYEMQLSWRTPCEEWGREALFFIQSNRGTTSVQTDK